MVRKMIGRFFVTVVALVIVLSLSSVPVSKAGDGFKVFGYGQAWYVSDDSDVSAGNVSSEFLMRRARLGVEGTYGGAQIPVDFKFVGEFAGYNSTTTTTVIHPYDGSTETTTTTDRGSASLLDAYLNIPFSPLFQVQMGQFKYHYTEIGTASSKIKAIGLVYRPEVVQNIHGNLGRSGGSLRDVGLRIHGVQKGGITYNYDLEFINGDGANKADRNDNKVILVHLAGKVGGIKVFGAYFTGKDGTVVNK